MLNSDAYCYDWPVDPNLCERCAEARAWGKLRCTYHRLAEQIEEQDRNRIEACCPGCHGRVERIDEEMVRCLNCGATTDLFEAQKAIDTVPAKQVE